MKSEFHIQNIFDALNSSGEGVIGALKSKCMYLQNRALGMAKSGDIVAVSADFPNEYGEYISNLKKIKDLTFLRFDLTSESKTSLNDQSFSSNSLFELIEAFDSNLANKVKQMNPKLQPYMHSASFYEAAAKFGWVASSQIGKDDLVGQMNDKTVLYTECRKKQIPFPKSRILEKEGFLKSVKNLMDANHEEFLSEKIFIRQARSGGGLGNITTEKIESQFFIHETREILSQSDFDERMERYVNGSYSSNFLVSELLELYASPGTLFYVNDLTTHVIAHTGQILTPTREFTGFMFPIRNLKITKYFALIEKYVIELTEQWRKEGFRGFGNLDWMITRYDEKLYIAERNARQTAVVSPLKVVSSIFGNGNSLNFEEFRLPNDIAVITQDALHLTPPSPQLPSITFNLLKNKLHEFGLILERNGANKEGVIITIPPTDFYGPNQVGVMIIGQNPNHAIDLLRNCSTILNAEIPPPEIPCYWDDWTSFE